MRHAALAVIVLLCLAIRTQTQAADSLSLTWDPNPPEEEVLGYRVYVGTAYGVYTGVFDVGNQTNFVYPNTVPGQEYFFAVAAYNAVADGLRSEVSAFSNAPPSLVNPGDQQNSVGEAVALQLDGYDMYGEAVSYTADGLPPGLTLDGSTGLISGAGTSIGIYTVTVTVTDGLLSTPETFIWFIDGSPPTVAITSPTILGTYSASGGTVALAGTASDDLGVAHVTWVNNRGGSGAAIDTTSWTIPTVLLLAGENIITITAQDLAGRTTTVEIVVTSPGSPVPMVAITLPTPSPTFSADSNPIYLGGIALDSLGVTAVTWASNRGWSGTADITVSSLASWIEPEVWLLPGLNVITVTAWNALGQSGTAVVTVIHNQAPTLANPGDQTNAEGDVVSLQLAGDDLDGDSVTYTESGLPPGLTLDTSSGLISGALPYTAAGEYSATLAVSDSQETIYEFLTWMVTNTPMPVTPVVTAVSKPYDGSTSATLASCTLTGAAGGGLVAAFSFDEGTGQTILDSSGLGNHGVLVSGSWSVAGVHGGAMSFNGVDGRIMVPDSASLRLTTAMTLEAWVSPAAMSDVWRDIIYKGNDDYYLSTSSGWPFAGGTFTEGTAGRSPLAVNTWVHLAATYDGLRLRLYVNGMEVSSKPQSGMLETSVSELGIGGDSAFGQHFAGSIDEVRIYNVALTPAEIQADMMIGAEAVACSGPATFDSAAAGSDKTLTVSGVSLTGPTAAEFTLATTTATSTTAVIEPRPVTAVVTAAGKQYDGTAGATLTGCTVIGLLGNDAVECSGTATFNTPGAGAAKTVTVNLALTGADAGNYTPGATSATTTASIEPRTVTPAVTVADKRYDGTTSATILSCAVSPRMDADAVACTGTAAFASADVGTGKTVMVSALTLTGAAAPNYALDTTATTTTAAIHLNRAPVITNPGEQSSFRGGGVVVPVTAIDPDGDSLTFSAAGLPSGITIDSLTGELSGAAATLGVFTVVLSASDGSAVGQASFLWIVEAPPVPDPATPVSPSGSIATRTPEFSWTADGAARYYLVSIVDASSDSPTRVWYTPEDAGCPIGGTCTVAAPKSLASGLVSWMVLTWNPFGYGPWSTTMSTIVDVADGAVPTPVLEAPSGPIATRTPTYSWTSISSAIWYQLSVTDALGVVRGFWYSPAKVCLSASCAVTPNVLLAIGPAQWKVRAWRMSGAGAWSTPVAFDATDSVPGTATLVSPLAPVATVTPSFTWNAVLGTSYYLLRVTDRDNVTVDRWYLPGAAACPLGIGACVVSPGIALKAGKANWMVLTWNGSGYGPWSTTHEFLVEIPDPAALAPAALSPTGTIGSASATYRWTAVAGALSYRIAIRNNGGAPAYVWYSPVAAGCQAAAECSAVPPITLVNGTADWRVQAWTNLGYGPWSPTLPLTVSIGPPSAPTLVSPSGPAGSKSPAFQWNASANATLFYIRVYDVNGLRIDRWLSPAEAGCASGGTCTLNSGVTLASGAGSWQVIAWNPTAYSPWSTTVAFIVP